MAQLLGVADDGLALRGLGAIACGYRSAPRRWRGPRGFFETGKAQCIHSLQPLKPNGTSIVSMFAIGHLPKSLTLHTPE